MQGAGAGLSAVTPGRAGLLRTGTILFMTSSGFATPRAEMPMPLLPVPYAAPMFAKMRAKPAPMNPQKGASGAALANSSSDTVVWTGRSDTVRRVPFARWA